MLGVDVVSGFLPLLKLHHRLDLARNVLLGPGGDIRFFHQLQEICLHPPTTDISPARRFPLSNLVDLINVDDPILGLADITIGPTNQLTHQVLNIATHIARFRKLGGIALDEGHPDQFGNRPNEVGFPHAGGTQKNHILFGVTRKILPLLRHSDVVIVVTKRNAEHLLRFVLPDDISVQIGLHLFWKIGEFKLLFLFLLGLGSGPVLSIGLKPCGLTHVRHVLPH